jgi:hypothetical protein
LQDRPAFALSGNNLVGTRQPRCPSLSPVPIRLALRRFRSRRSRRVRSWSVRCVGLSSGSRCVPLPRLFRRRRRGRREKRHDRHAHLHPLREKPTPTSRPQSLRDHRCRMSSRFLSPPGQARQGLLLLLLCQVMSPSRLRLARAAGGRQARGPHRLSPRRPLPSGRSPVCWWLSPGIEPAAGRRATRNAS